MGRNISKAPPNSELIWESVFLAHSNPDNTHHLYRTHLNIVKALPFEKPRLDYDVMEKAAPYLSLPPFFPFFFFSFSSVKRQGRGLKYVDEIILNPLLSLYKSNAACVVCIMTRRFCSRGKNKIKS